MIAQSRPLQNFINVVTGTISDSRTSMYDVPYDQPKVYAVAAGNDWNPAIPEKIYWTPPESLNDLGKLLLRQKRRANFQLVHKRRNRNLHIQ